MAVNGLRAECCSAEYRRFWRMKESLIGEGTLVVWGEMLGTAEGTDAGKDICARNLPKLSQTVYQINIPGLRAISP
ncbi:hypothetical protein BT69DRAFT_1282616 [Atractiella rhizophila]|nr:hypothetical protein BT69DRAFT_1282616 [Atractiella rhizophila]